MKRMTLLAIFLLSLAVNVHATTKPIEVSIDTPSSGWGLKIQSAHTHNNQLLLVCKLTHAGGASATVISKVTDSIELAENLADLKRKVYVLGKTWNWGKGYTAVTPKQLKAHLEGSKTVYTAKSAEPTDPAKTPSKLLKGNDSDFINLSYEEAVKLAKKRKLKYRIVKKDGRSLSVTKDMRRDRVNFVVLKNVIIRVSRG